jgi:hypothetical protein
MANGLSGAAVQVARVLEQLAPPGSVLSGSTPGGAAIRVVSYPADFAYLWSVGEWQDKGYPETGVPTEGVSDLVIVWEGLPSSDGSVNIARHLSPVDWAIALGCRDLRHDGEESQRRAVPELRVWVIDRTLDLPDDVWIVSAKRLFPADRIPGLPWVRVIGRDEPVGSVLAGVLGLTISASPPRTLRASHADPAERALFTQLRWLWGCGLTAMAPSDRHALSNLLGPLMILGATGRSVAEQAAYRLVTELGLTSGSLQSRSVWIDWTKRPWSELLDRLKLTGAEPLRLLLVDDAAFGLRWADVVAQALGTTDKPAVQESGKLVLVGSNRAGVELYATDSVRTFHTHFPAPRTGEASASDRRFVVGFQTAAGNAGSKLNLDALFLDLRLHQGGSRSEEIDSFADALTLAGETPADRPGWPTIPASELTAVEQWIEFAERPVPAVDDDHDGYEIGLSLLARAISRTDLALPIVLFTSTRRRELMNKFRQYGTILSNWEKPGLSSFGTVDDTRERFAEVLKRAMNFAIGRRAVRRLIEFPPPIITPSASVEKEWVVEVLLDETGCPPDPSGVSSRRGGRRHRLAVGGLVVIYPAVAAAQLETEAEKVYPAYESRPVKKQKEALRDACEPLLQGLDGVAAKFGGAVVPFWLACDAWDSRQASDDPLLNLQHVDNLHREMTRTSIELALFWIAPRFVPENASVTADIRAATRRRRLVECPEVAAGKLTDLELKRRLEEEWGELVERYPSTHSNYPNDYFTQSITTDTPRAILEEIRGHYTGTRFFPHMRLTRAFKLDPRRRVTHDDPTALHLLADAVVGPDRQRSIRAVGPQQLVCRYAFEGEFALELRKLLEMGRLARHKDAPEALAAFATSKIAANPLADGPRGEFRNLLLGELMPVLQNLSGPDFVRYAELLSQRPM